MSRTRVTGEGLITGDGISGFASRSDLARMRELSKYGLEMSWYDEKVQEQSNTCADCHKQETQRLGNGKRRPLGLGFDANGQPSRLICTNCASKQRKARMEELNKPQDCASFEEFWQVNREHLQKEDATTLATLQERDQDVRELYEVIVIFVRRHDGKPCFQLTDALDEVTEELVTHGTTDLDQLSCPFYRVEHRQVFVEIQEAAELPNAPAHARNCATYAKYGWLQALPVSAGDHAVREFLRRNGRWPYPDWSKPPNPIKTIKCCTPGCKSEFTYNQNDRVPGWYFSPCINAAIPPAQWHCEKCRADQQARHDKRIGRSFTEVAADRPYFVNGRLTTADTSNAAWFQKLPGA